MAVSSFPAARRSSFADLAPPGLVLRAARDGDLAFLRRLYRGLRAEELAQLPWSDDERRRFCDQQFALQHADWTARYADGWFLLLMQGGSPVGRFYLSMLEDTLHLIELALLPNCRGRGNGGRLLTAVQDYARRQGIGLTLRVAHTNPRARALYERLGFQPDQEEETHCLMRWSR